VWDMFRSVDTVDTVGMEDGMEVAAEGGAADIMVAVFYPSSIPVTRAIPIRTSPGSMPG
jgi:hypothetical protein